MARLGGDEFVVLLEHTGGPGATAALGRLRRSLEGGWSEVTGGHEVGAALGITTYRAGDSVATLLARADAEMYADKARRAGSSEPAGAGRLPPVGTRVDRVPGLA